MIGVHAQDPGAGSFLAELVQVFRAEEGDGQSDFELLHPLIVPPARRRAAAVDPDPDVFWRIELFHRAVGRAIERRTGVACQPLLRMHHEGHGLLVLVAGRLVAVARQLRDVGAFGFDSIEALAEAGERLVSEGTELIDRYPELARFNS